MKHGMSSEKIVLTLEVAVALTFIVGSVLVALGLHGISHERPLSMLQEPIANKTLSDEYYYKKCSLPVYETGSLASRGATIYAIKNTNGTYYMFLAVLPIKGEFWSYKQLPNSYSYGLHYLGHILVVNSSGSIEMYYYNFTSRKYVFIEKVPEQAASIIMADIKAGLYKLQTPHDIRPI